MNILSPLDNSNEINVLAEAGADNFYCGVISEEWNKKYTAVASPNRREWKENSFKDFDELEKAVKIAHSFNKKVFLTANAHYYSNEQYPLLLKEIQKAVNIGIDGLVVSDIALILKLKEMGIKTEIIISTGGATLNSETAKFYAEIGATRIVLPRHVTIPEISNIIKDCPNIKFHAFVLNEGCFNLDGFCTFHHGIDSSKWENRTLACSLPYDIKIREKVTPLKERTIKYRLNNLTKNLLINCGACALYDFDKIGLDSIKIIGRGNPTEKKVKDVKFFRELLDYLKKCKNKDSFILKAKSLYGQFYHHKCTYRNCYYPEL